MGQQYTIDTSQGRVTVKPHSRSKRLKLRIHPNGTISVTAPLRVSERIVKDFIESQTAWIAKHRPMQVLIRQGDYIGREHTINFIKSGQEQVRVANGIIKVTYRPESTTLAQLQSLAAEGAHRALKREAEEMLPHRLYELARMHGFNYESVSVKKMTSRWGSCSSVNSINLSTYLVQLPDELVTYVLVHELAHTLEHNHAPAFWKHVEKAIPHYQLLRKELRKHHPSILPNSLEA